MACSYYMRPIPLEVMKMRWILIFATTLALSACGGSNTSTSTPEQASTPDRTQPSQQEKAADVKTEAAGEHFQNGMSQPDKMMQAMQKEAPTAMQQTTKPEAAPAQATTPAATMQQPVKPEASPAQITSPATATQQAMEPAKKVVETAAPASTEIVAKVIGTTWKRCAVCHNFTDAPKVGPGLAKVLGRKAGSMGNFHYKFTQYIKGKAWVWDEAHLKKWMCNSKEAIKEFTGDPSAQTKMPVQHICSPEEQKSVLSKLKSIS